MLALRRAASLVARHQARTMSTTSPHVFDLAQADFKDKVIDSKVPVVLDFTATWCGPCKMLKPLLEKIVTEHGGDVVLAKLDIDDNQALAAKFEISSVPTVLGIKQGVIVDGFMGVKQEADVREFVKNLIEMQVPEEK